MKQYVVALYVGVLLMVIDIHVVLPAPVLTPAASHEYRVTDTAKLAAYLRYAAPGARELTAALVPSQIPDPLRPWTDWVLHGETDRDCPFLYNSYKDRRCGWPTRLQLTLDDNQGQFVQTWWLDAESWLFLPGDNKRWPHNVTVNGEPGTVIVHEERPAMRLPPGRYELRGEFLWERLPETLAVPVDTGLIELTVKGKRLPSPAFETDGRLWLRERDSETADKAVEDRAEIQVFRRIIDDIPLQVVTHMTLLVSGRPRELMLTGALMQDLIPLSLQSALTARLEPGGKLRLQVRPGRWLLTLTARHPRPLNELKAESGEAPWPDHEVWVFEARHHLRLVEVEGMATIDPRQTNLPQDWQHLPAYRIRPGDVMTFKVIRRGDPEPEPNNLHLQRTLWLDFDGEGYTVKDQVTGSMTRGWRLSMPATMELGRVAIDGKPQFITRLPGTDEAGIEVRRGALRLEADSRINNPARRLPVLGWRQDFQNAGVQLQLPPGWKLLAAPGVDHVPDTWIARWTLLDLFVVLITTLSIVRLWNWRWGVLTLVTLALIWHEPFAPQYVWLNLLATIALLRVLPAGHIERLVRWYLNLGLLALALITVPFMVHQVRTGLYPQLATPGTGEFGLGWRIATDQRVTSPPSAVAPSPPDSGKLKETAKRLMAEAEEGPRFEQRQQVSLAEFDPKATLQTGPGLPNWQWAAVPLTWRGPVTRDQEFRLFLLSPDANLILNMLRVLLTLILALLVFGLRYERGRGWQRHAGTLALMVLTSWVLGNVTDVLATDFPSQEMLMELRQRLIEPPKCLPACAQSPRLHLILTPSHLTARMAIHTGADVAVPLPGASRHWSPTQVSVNGTASENLARDASGTLWLKLPPGQHQVLLHGPLPQRTIVELRLPLTPHHVEVDATGWRVDGVHEDGLADQQLKLTRLELPNGTPPQEFEAAVLPPFVHIERTLRLGLDWRVETLITRVSPSGASVVLQVPLIAGEAVTTEGIRVVDRHVLVNMGADQSQLFWSSGLDKTEQLILIAPQETEWSETWRLDAGPVWHVVPTGFPVVHHQDPNGRWLPEWRPWPGERVTLAISRPVGVEGKTLTIDRSTLELTPGQRATDARLDLIIRSSLGTQHTITLPQGAQLQSVNIGGTAQPIRQDGDNVTLPIVPGEQQVHLTWRTSDGLPAHLQAPRVDLGTNSVNSNVHIRLPRNRWTLLTGGPRLGPAVLFWVLLIVIVLIAFGLGRVTLTPLTTWQWFFLGIGLSQAPVWTGLVVVGWLLALGARARLPQDTKPAYFQGFQIVLVLLTAMALRLLLGAIQQGLLGLPEMQIAGNHSTAYQLNWYQDRTGSMLPRPWVLSVPLMVYRLAMLAWALWLAFALLVWLRWGWQCFSTHGLWRKYVRRTPETVDQQDGKTGEGLTEDTQPG